MLAQVSPAGLQPGGAVSPDGRPTQPLQLQLFDGEAAKVPERQRNRAFRPIHYLGSKLRVLGAIEQAIDEADPGNGPVCDLFAGSGTVSLALSQSRRVVAMDIQEYSRVLCGALLNPVDVPPTVADELGHVAADGNHAQKLSFAVEPLRDHEMECVARARDGELEPLCELLEHGPLLFFERGWSKPKSAALRDAFVAVSARLEKLKLANGPGALVTRYFGGLYFSYSQAAELDAILEAVHGTPTQYRNTLLAAALSSASDLVNTVGKQFAQPIRPRDANGEPKRHLAEQVSRDRHNPVLPLFLEWVARYSAWPQPGQEHSVYRCDYREGLHQLRHESVGVIYADPPYTRDHYSRYYHVLETLCLRDNPEISTMRVNGHDYASRGAYRLVRHQSPFCIMSQAPAAFEALFSGVRDLDVPLVLSYSPYKANASRPRCMTFDGLQEMARKQFGNVHSITAAGVNHSKLGWTVHDLGRSYEAEVLLICRP